MRKRLKKKKKIYIEREIERTVIGRGAKVWPRKCPSYFSEGNNNAGRPLHSALAQQMSLHPGQCRHERAGACRRRAGPGSEKIGARVWVGDAGCPSLRRSPLRGNGAPGRRQQGRGVAHRRGRARRSRPHAQAEAPRDVKRGARGRTGAGGTDGRCVPRGYGEKGTPRGTYGKKTGFTDNVIIRATPEQKKKP
jgi:hypothetical protein